MCIVRLQDGPLGIVLISVREKCTFCGTKLNTKADRTSRVTVYTDFLGAVRVTHYSKYCRKQGTSSTMGFPHRGTLVKSPTIQIGSTYHTLCLLERLPLLLTCFDI